LLTSAPPSPLFPYTTLFRSDAPAQLLVVVALQAGAAGMREQHLVAAVAAHVLLVGAADVADHVREQLGVRVAPVQVRHHLHARRSEEHTSELQSRENLVSRL